MLIRADARHIPLKDKTVQCCLTSPPYFGLRDYKIAGQIGLEKTPEAYVAAILSVMREVWRVLKDDGTLWLNLGDSYSSGGRKDYDHALISRTSGLQNNAAGILRSTPLWAKPKDLLGIPWRVAFALQADGWYLRSDIIWAKPNPMPESVRDRPTKAHEYIFLLSKSEHYFYDTDAISEPVTCARKRGPGPMVQPGTGRNDSGRIGDYRTFGKWSAEHRQSSGRRMIEGVKAARLAGNDHDNPFGPNRNCRTVWQVPTLSYSGAHFATFPREIAERCIKAGSGPGDIVLDPFVGSGTTVMVAQDLGRIGIGLDLTYQDLAAERIGGSLFKRVVNSTWH